MNPLTAHGVIALLLRLHPGLPMDHRDEVELRVQMILDACREAGVTRCTPVVATCFVESGLRTRSHNAPLCGCKPYGTDDATQARCAARSWRTSLARCRTPLGAATRYGYGLCRVPRGRRFRRARAAQSRRAALVTRLTNRLETNDGSR